ncbi:YveK family protein [Nocardioides piscis]|uniref:Polysaccharide chain length determinant N-terminal domain-containing protein n=1 Tax=Nocardioides piscis TaxID=2714938 RepID=A0A6G7YEN2_9ACTN|nr:Wzz/FepE/Etk N-terminal domain-containing protein [Nocardioides piscis]QIK75253.1 hypothetical protein G7071_07235 [Nocardioides piscis]
MDLKDYWLTLRRRWRIVVASLGVVVAIAAILSFTATPQFESSTRLFVSTSQADDSTTFAGGAYATQRVTSYADLVGSRELAERVVEALDADLDPADLPSMVTATVVPETVLLEITVTNPESEVARDLAQSYAEELQDLVDELETPEGKREAPIKATIVDDAQETSDPVSPDPVRNLALAAVLGLLLGLGLAVARELLDTSIRANTDVTDVTDAPILANIVADDAAMLPRARPSRRRRRGPSRSGCCAPTCNMSRSTRTRRSS